MPATGAAARPAAAPIDETFFTWVQLHSREVLIGVVVLIVVGAGGLLYRAALATQAGQADAALAGPEQSLATGNIPLAQADLKKVIARYGGTAAAAHASLLRVLSPKRGRGRGTGARAGGVNINRTG